MPRQPQSPNKFLVSIRKPGKRDSGRFYFWIRPPVDSGQAPFKRSSGCTDRAGAERGAQELAARLNSRLGGTPQDPTALEIFDLHLEHVEADANRARKRGEVPDLSADQIGNYKKARPWIALGFAGVTASALTGEVVEEALARILAGEVNGRRLRRVTASKYVGLCGCAWSWVRAHPRRTGVSYLPEWIRARHPRGIKARDSHKTKRKPFAPIHLSVLLGDALEDERGHYYPALRMLNDCGMRVCEAVGRDVGDVQRDPVGWWLSVAPSKSSPARKVPLLPDLVELLNLDRPAQEPLFLSVTGKRQRADVLRMALRRILVRAGIDPVDDRGEGYRRLHLLDNHSFRRAWITHAKLAGVTSLVRREIVGHSALGVHEGYSRNYVPAGLHGALEQVREWRRAACRTADVHSTPIESADPGQHPEPAQATTSKGLAVTDSHLLHAHPDASSRIEAPASYPAPSPVLSGANLLSGMGAEWSPTDCGSCSEAPAAESLAASSAKDPASNPDTNAREHARTSRLITLGGDPDAGPLMRLICRATDEERIALFRAMFVRSDLGCAVWKAIEAYWPDDIAGLQALSQARRTK